MASIRDRIVDFRRVKAGELRAHPGNWRQHPKAQREALEGMLNEIGYADAILARETPDGLQIVDGHLRASLDPEQEVPVLVLDLDEEESRKLLLTLDPLAAMAQTDTDALASLMSRTRLESDAVNTMLTSLLDAGGPEPTVMTDEEDERSTARSMRRVEEKEYKPFTKRGQVWKLGEHRLMCGDSTSRDDVSRLLAVSVYEWPHIMVTDPPYGVEYNASWRHDAGVNNSPQIGKVSNDERASWASAYRLFPGDVAYVWHAARFTASVERSLAALGFEVRAQIVWVKKRFAISRGHYHWRHEPCWYAVRKDGKAAWIGGRKQNTTWADIATAPEEERADYFAAPVDEELYVFPGHTTTVWEIGHDKAVGGGHSTQKPVECMARPLRNHEGNVYDPFVGSGSTVIAAEKLGRRCYAMEIEPRYCDVVIRRWEEYTGGKAEVDDEQDVEDGTT